jgi:hypothetical protein
MKTMRVKNRLSANESNCALELKIMLDAAAEDNKNASAVNAEQTVAVAESEEGALAPRSRLTLVQPNPGPFSTPIPFDDPFYEVREFPFTRLITNDEALDTITDLPVEEFVELPISEVIELLIDTVPPEERAATREEADMGIAQQIRVNDLTEEEFLSMSIIEFVGSGEEKSEQFRKEIEQAEREDRGEREERGERTERKARPRKTADRAPAA